MNKHFGRKIIQLMMGRDAPESKEFVSVPKIEEILKDLVVISEKDWGKYAFSREPLNGKFTEETRGRLIFQGNECGVKYAEQMLEIYGQITPQELAVKLGLDVKFSPMPTGGGRVLFAQFVEPNKIMVFEDCIDKAKKLLEGNELFPTAESLNLKQILLAHEIFHYLEEIYKDEIFTRTEKVQLWALKPFRYTSGIVCLGEIAGMAFAKRYLNLLYSPYVLDVLLVYGYSPEAAYHLYLEIMKLVGNRSAAFDDVLGCARLHG